MVSKYNYCKNGGNISIKIITEFEGHHFIVSLDKESTNIPPGTYLYDIQLNLADGRVDTIILPTKFTVLGGVTLD